MPTTYEIASQIVKTGFGRKIRVRGTLSTNPALVRHLLPSGPTRLQSGHFHESQTGRWSMTEPFGMVATLAKLARDSEFVPRRRRAQHSWVICNRPVRPDSNRRHSQGSKTGRLSMSDLFGVVATLTKPAKSQLEVSKTASGFERRINVAGATDKYTTRWSLGAIWSKQVSLAETSMHRKQSAAP